MEARRSPIKMCIASHLNVPRSMLFGGLSILAHLTAPLHSFMGLSACTTCSLLFAPRLACLEENCSYIGFETHDLRASPLSAHYPMHSHTLCPSPSTSLECIPGLSNHRSKPQRQAHFGWSFMRWKVAPILFVPSFPLPTACAPLPPSGTTSG